MKTNPWFKLVGVALVGIIISFAVLWGIGQFNTNGYYNGYQGQGNMNNNQYRYYNQNGMNIQGGMNMQRNGNGGMSVQGGVNMPGNMNGNMNIQGGRGMMYGR